jgi:hypothetical protein
MPGTCICIPAKAGLTKLNLLMDIPADSSSASKSLAAFDGRLQLLQLSGIALGCKK